MPKLGFTFLFETEATIIALFCGCVVCKLRIALNITSPCVLSNWTIESVRISWPATSGAEYYRVARNGSLVAYVAQREVSVDKLSAATFYEFSVTAYGRQALKGNTVFCAGITGGSVTKRCIIAESQVHTHTYFNFMSPNYVSNVT